MYFRNYRLRITCLDHCLKSAVSEQHLTVNMLKGPKHLSNLLNITFIIFLFTLRETDLKNTLLLICEILGHFLNTLTSDD